MNDTLEKNSLGKSGFSLMLIYLYLTTTVVKDGKPSQCLCSKNAKVIFRRLKWIAVWLEYMKFLKLGERQLYVIQVRTLVNRVKSGSCAGDKLQVQ